LVHCRSGKGRSGVAVAAYLMYRYCMDPEKAIEIVRSIVRDAIGSEEQIEAVYMFWRTYVETRCRSRDIDK